MLAQKCAHAHIEVPNLATIRSSPFREEIAREWKNMLGHQLPQPLPPFASFWETLDQVFAWLAGDIAVAVPPRAGGNDLDPTWIAPRAITSWRRGFPFELIRYAGANRLKVDIDYRPLSGGRSGPRIVEPYSLRRTLDRKRIDRIAGVRPTDETYEPQYLVEF